MLYCPALRKWDNRLLSPTLSQGNTFFLVFSENTQFFLLSLQFIFSITFFLPCILPTLSSRKLNTMTHMSSSEQTKIWGWTLQHAGKLFVSSTNAHSKLSLTLCKSNETIFISLVRNRWCLLSLPEKRKRNFLKQWNFHHKWCNIWHP